MFICKNKNNGLEWQVNEGQKKIIEEGIFSRSFVFTEITEEELKTVETPPEAKPKRSKKKNDAPDK